MANYYLGKIVKVEDRVTYEVKVDIDGIAENKPAFPLRGEVDEPKIGDQVLLKNIDPLYGSVYLYSKLKEDKFIGFRSNGKAIDITPEYIELSVYKAEDDANDDDFRKKPITYVKVSDNGDMNIHIGATGNDAKLNLTIDGDVNIKCLSSTTITAPDIVVKGPGILEVKSQSVIPDIKGGPFCTFKVAPPAGTPMVTGSKIILGE